MISLLASAITSRKAQESKLGKVSYLIEFAIEPDRVGEFKSKAATFIASVRENEPETLIYNWHYTEDGTRCVLHEGFSSSETLLTHLDNIGPTLPDLLAIAPITRFEVLGLASDEVHTALDGLGVVYLPHVAGFERT